MKLLALTVIAVMSAVIGIAVAPIVGIIAFPLLLARLLHNTPERLTPSKRRLVR